MADQTHTAGPWFVRDFRASEMRRLGWTGPSIDRILIVTKTGQEIVESEGENCVVARIQFDNRTEELTPGNLADAYLIAAAPALRAAMDPELLELAADHALKTGNPKASRNLMALAERQRAALAKSTPSQPETK